MRHVEVESVDYASTVRRLIDTGEPFAIEVVGEARAVVRARLRGQELDWAPLAATPRARAVFTLMMLALPEGARVSFVDASDSLRVEVTPVPRTDPAELADEFERRSGSLTDTLGLELPREHMQLLEDPTDPLHECLDFLLLSGKRRERRLLWQYGLLRSKQHDPWPAHLVAFATTGCGDWYAYDLRTTPPSVLYVDPDRTVAENQADDDRIVFESFAAFLRARRASTRR